MSNEQQVTAAAEAEKAAEETREAATWARDEAMRDAKASGCSVVSIAGAADLSRSAAHAVMRAGAGAARGGDALARVSAAAKDWRSARDAHKAALAALNIAVAEAMDSGTVSAARVQQITGWSAARPYQARDLGRALLAERG